MIILGIDPGLHGAIARLDTETMKIELHDMPLVNASNGKEDLDDRVLAQLLQPHSEGRNLAFLEKVHAMPRDGGTSAFRFGTIFGAIRMAIRAHGYECFYPTPPVWKKHFKLTGRKGMTDSEIKRMSLGLAKDRFPDATPPLTLQKHHGRAEAALIALYGAETILSL